MPITKDDRKRAAHLLTREVVMAIQEITDSGRKRWFSDKTLYKWTLQAAKRYSPEELALIIIANKTNISTGWEVHIASDFVALVEVILSEHISERLKSEGWECNAGPRTNDRWHNPNTSKHEGV